MRGVNHPSVLHLTGILANGLQVFTGILAERFAHRMQIIQHRQVALAQVAGFRQPVDHLEVDIAVIVVSPWSSKHSVPYALKSGWQTPWPGGLNHEVTAKVEERFLQAWVVGLLAVGFQTLECRHILKHTWRRTQRKALAPVHRRVVLRMTILEFIK